MTHPAAVTIAIFAAALLLFGVAVGVGRWLANRHEPKRWWWV